MPKRMRSTRPREQALGAASAAAAAATALQVAHELDDAGDAEYAHRCVEHAIEQARAAISLAGDRQHFCEDDPAPQIGPPPSLVASLGLSLLGGLAHAADDLDAARAAFTESLSIWPGNAAAAYKLADLEVQHGCFELACRLYEATSSLPPCCALRTSWYADLVSTPRSEAVAIASYMCALLYHRAGRFDEAVPHLRRIGVRHRLSPAVWSAVTASPSPPLPLPSLSSLAPACALSEVRGKAQKNPTAPLDPQGSSITQPAQSRLRTPTPLIPALDPDPP